MIQYLCIDVTIASPPNVYIIELQSRTGQDLSQQYNMKGQSEIAYLPKFANIMLIVMVIVINEIF